MELYLIRHGIAYERNPNIKDEERELTASGRGKTRKVAKRLYDLGLRFEVILTSPLVRSRQTAEILRSCSLSSQIEECSYLSPNGNIQDWLKDLEQKQILVTDTKFAMVGHQPDLGEWAEILVWGKTRVEAALTDISTDKSQSPKTIPEKMPLLILKKAGIIGLQLPETGSPVGCSQLFWLAPPKFLL
ncbi:MAG TPA: phosphohistidine phosphatase SixA [Cyanobacteria bacterium UBA11049]|nr:phosphohistidine phosphatase SixA [Cyanobacteria bacterium UBA11049]